MDIERGNLEILFKRITPDQIRIFESHNTKNLMAYNVIAKQIFCQTCHEQFPYYTPDEINNVFNELKESIEIHPAGIFDYLLAASKRLLVERGDEVQCKYADILRFREISFQLGQDLFSCAFLADRDWEPRKVFSWRPMMQSDNNRLHNILEQGMSENHFHLIGSTQIMTVNWICLMNFVENRAGEFASKKMEISLDSFRVHSLECEKRDSLMIACRKAALLRILLFEKLNAIQNDEQIVKRGSNIMDLIDLGIGVNELSGEIQMLRRLYGYKRPEDGYIFDYCLQEKDFDIRVKEYRLLCGERKFLYQCFRAIYTNQFDEIYANMFYQYLVIKTEFRKEMIQINRGIGFQNFANYQDRKKLFITKHNEYLEEAKILALQATLRQQRIQSLEARIGPEFTGVKLRKSIQYYDETVKNQEEDYNKLFYVLHFYKRKDNKPSRYYERHHAHRLDVKRYAEAIASVKGSIEHRVRGIDACSNENGCRPEIFGQAFRFLSDYRLTEQQRKLKQYNEFAKSDENMLVNMPALSESNNLHMTYHAGEDFIDMIDGLRAIDESILFCNLNRGDRIGHALALGVDPEKYYKIKNNKLVMPKQDLFDNLVWFLEETSTLILDSNEAVCRNEMLNLFKKMRNEIYPNYSNVDEHTFYDAWKLRGDNPECYFYGIKELQKQLKTEVFNHVYDKYAINKCRFISDIIRNNETCVNIYRDYHYDVNIKKVGLNQIEFCVNPSYIKIVRKIQDKMIRFVCEKGIGIETNPSSNYLIGPLTSYDEHPIIRFNSRKLKTNFSNTNSLFVSINTDDQGVFDTCLENEYAIIVRALEKEKDENGNPKYAIEDIYEWIDYVRQMGNEQTFR